VEEIYIPEQDRHSPTWSMQAGAPSWHNQKFFERQLLEPKQAFAHNTKNGSHEESDYTLFARLDSQSPPSMLLDHFQQL
jgi:hypothetical protein